MVRSKTWHATGVSISPEDFAAARSRAGLTQRELAARLDHSVEAVQKWERPTSKGGRGVPSGKEALVERVLAGFLYPDRTPPTLSSMSDMALMAEFNRISSAIAERLDMYRQQLDVYGVNRDQNVSEIAHPGTGATPTVPTNPPGNRYTGRSRGPRSRRKNPPLSGDEAGSPQADDDDEV